MNKEQNMNTEQLRAELLPCPFCGGAPKIVERDVEPQGDPWYGRKIEKFVNCACGACLFDEQFHEGFYSDEKAVEAWNRRAALHSQEREDAERLDWLRGETCDLRCINVPTGGDDYDVRWVVIQHHMSKPHEREIGRSFTDDPRDAIDRARRIEGEGE